MALCFSSDKIALEFIWGQDLLTQAHARSYPPNTRFFYSSSLILISLEIFIAMPIHHSFFRDLVPLWGRRKNTAPHPRKIYRLLVSYEFAEELNGERERFCKILQLIRNSSALLFQFLVQERNKKVMICHFSLLYSISKDIRIFFFFFYPTFSHGLWALKFKISGFQVRPKRRMHLSRQVCGVGNHM